MVGGNRKLYKFNALNCEKIVVEAQTITLKEITHNTVSSYYNT